MFCHVIHNILEKIILHDLIYRKALFKFSIYFKIKGVWVCRLARHFEVENISITIHFLCIRQIQIISHKLMVLIGCIFQVSFINILVYIKIFSWPSTHSPRSQGRSKFILYATSNCIHIASRDSVFKQVERGQNCSLKPP